MTTNLEHSEPDHAASFQIQRGAECISVLFRDRWIFGRQGPNAATDEDSLGFDAVGHKGCFGRIACGHKGCFGRIACGNPKGVKLVAGMDQAGEIEALFRSTMGEIPESDASIHELLASRRAAQAQFRR